MDDYGIKKEIASLTLAMTPSSLSLRGLSRAEAPNEVRGQARELTKQSHIVGDENRE